MLISRDFEQLGEQLDAVAVQATARAGEQEKRRSGDKTGLNQDGLLLRSSGLLLDVPLSRRSSVQCATAEPSSVSRALPNGERQRQSGVTLIVLYRCFGKVNSVSVMDYSFIQLDRLRVRLITRQRVRGAFVNLFASLSSLAKTRIGVLPR